MLIWTAHTWKRIWVFENKKLINQISTLFLVLRHTSLLSSYGVVPNRSEKGFFIKQESAGAHLFQTWWLLTRHRIKPNSSASPVASIGSGAGPSLTSNLLPYLVLPHCPLTLGPLYICWISKFCPMPMLLTVPHKLVPPCHFHLNSSIPCATEPFPSDPNWKWSLLVTAWPSDTPCHLEPSLLIYNLGD